MILAKQFVRAMKGCTRPSLLLCSDGNYYVTKFQSNPNGPRVLANQYLGSRLASLIGLPAPAVDVVFVDSDLVCDSPGVVPPAAYQRGITNAGLQCGSRYIVDPMQGTVFDHLPSVLLTQVSNADAVVGLLAFDCWVNYYRPPDLVYWRMSYERTYRVAFVDQGSCFGGREWSIDDVHSPAVLGLGTGSYRTLRGWTSFDPWLNAIECVTQTELESIAAEIPENWYLSWGEMRRLIARLVQRKHSVRSRIAECIAKNKSCFPNWTTAAPPRKSPLPTLTAARMQTRLGRQCD